MIGYNEWMKCKPTVQKCNIGAWITWWQEEKKGLRKGTSVKWFKHVVTLNQWLKLWTYTYGLKRLKYKSEVLALLWYGIIFQIFVPNVEDLWPEILLKAGAAQCAFLVALVTPVLQSCTPVIHYNAKDARGSLFIVLPRLPEGCDSRTVQFHVRIRGGERNACSWTQDTDKSVRFNLYSPACRQ